ncbi:MAG: energy transducer TonB [Gammaproteobacteria bacterium]
MIRSCGRLLVVALWVSFSQGCVSDGDHFNGPIIEIDGDLLGRYWLVRQSESSFDAPPAQRDDCTSGFVSLRYVIDSHGHVYEAEILEAEPEGCYEDAAMTLLQTWTFLPTYFNKRRSPVLVTQRIPFSTE